MPAPTQQFEAGRRAHRRVWWLATLGLIAGSLVLALVSSTLRQFRSSREHLERVQASVRGLSTELGHIADKVRTTQEELLSAELTNPRPATWPTELSDSLSRARALYLQPGVATVLIDLQRTAGRFAHFEEQRIEWHTRRLQAHRRLAVAARELEDRLYALTAAVTTEAGRQKLRTAGKVIRFRRSDGTNAVNAAREMVVQLQSESDLTETTAEITELARFSARLASEVNLDDLANLKDNLMAASLARLRQDLARTDPTVAANLTEKLQAVERILFGTNTVDTASTERPPEGLYHWRQTYLRLEKQRGQLLKSIAEGIQDFHTRQSELDEAMSRLVRELAESAESRLRLVWWNTMAVGVLASGLFILLAASVARTIRRQMSDVEQARLSVAAERAQLAAFVEHAPAAVAMFDTDIRYLAVSRRWLVEYLEGQDVTGRSHYEVFTDIPARWRQIHERCLAGAVERCDDDCWLPPDSKQEQHLRWEVRPWFDGTRHIAGIMMFSQDITVDRLREAELARMRDVANEASRAKSEFLATMSHEIRTPMNGVLGFTNLLLDTPLSNEQRQFVQTIRNSGESLLNIINDILDFSKIEAGKLTVESIQFNLCELLEQAAELLASQAEEKNLQLAIHYAIGAPQLLIGDPGRVRQAALNLLGNAIKFTSRGHVLLSVAADPQRSSAVRISITDTGIGIAPEKHLLLFNKFTQTDSSTTRRFGGTGLGLAISKQLVELMGGQIGVTSDGRSGSTFWFSLPVPANVVQPPRPALPSDVVRCRALVLQPNEVHRQIFTEQFKALGVGHLGVNTTREAVDALRNGVSDRNPFEIVIIDQADVSAIAQLKEAGHPIPLGVLISTPGHRWTELQKDVQGSFATCLVKPLVRTSHLVSALSAACRMREQSSCARPLGASTSASREPASGETPAPLNRGTVAEMAPVPAGPAEGTRSSGPARYRVLVAEDNATNQVLARRFLESLGCQVDVAINGREAVELSRKSSYDIIFMDCHMPEVDGFSATETIRREEAVKGESGVQRSGSPRLPIVALTASAFEEDRQRASDAGMDGFISKPVTKLELRRALTTWVDRTDNVSM